MDKEKAPVIQQALLALATLKESADKALLSYADHKRNEQLYEEFKAFLEGIEVNPEGRNTND